MTDFTLLRKMMVDTQVRPSDVTKFPIIEAMLSVPREDFVPASRRATAYVGENIDLGGGRVVLEPRTFAKMLDALSIDLDHLVLDLGCNFGYSAAVLSRLAEAVVAVEPDHAMAREAEQALAQVGADNVAVIEGPLAEGAPKHGPYDAVVVQGAVEHLPDTITNQIKEGGRVACLFQERTLGVVRIGWKVDGHMNWRYAFNAGAPVLQGFERRQAFAL
ncbi:protein-L-isoaspartate O-methyltransferase family protein [Roseitranquillus sediminis]|uniref:protein-L-isoaspartate O-methyltransferase family protein n=1 Tax=Roseitranquillus sediminis TaxID=2809051 RepID=UPI001D0C55CA|nr:protein-L-isoaspartate O-methyltransferase [Roseitranquillus sediminis]MBM9595803.1 protein-L-isoaspartate O-methyltransferase [Roseitranquillus sediminis]